MRDYGSVSPRFWIGDTGKQLRGDPEAQVLALYLMTSPHANMIGVFHCPLLYMAHETGLTLEGATKALAKLVALGFCLYDEPSETVFVIRMAAHQVGEQLKEGDKRIQGIRKEWEKIGVSHLKDAYFDVYGDLHGLPKQTKTPSPIEAPSKPLTASPIQGATEAPPKQLTGTGQEQEQEYPPQAAPRSPKAKSKKTPLPDGFTASSRVLAWMAEKGYGHIDRHVENFVSYVKRNGKTYADWDEALMTAIRDDWAKVGGVNGKPAADGWVTK